MSAAAVAFWPHTARSPASTATGTPSVTHATSRSSTSAGRPRAAGPVTAGRRVRAVVMGDSTAAGAGLPALPGASADGAACGRSAESFARDLETDGHWRVVNLACDGATIGQGILGPQVAGGRTVPAQLTVAQRVRHPSVVIVSVGADDLDWGAMVLGCAVTRNCAGPAAPASFRPALGSFRAGYRLLLGRLATLAGHPRVIINQYYDPFGPAPGCLSAAGLTPAKLRVLGARLASLNRVLARGAARYGFTSVRPDFAGHQICSAHPYVQGLLDPAPFHPTAGGELAIARADRTALGG